MGLFVNSDNYAFRTAVSGKIYVDKTGLLELTNRFLGTPQSFICVSRPRRFGKSTVANMLAAYYSRGCDSHDLFAGLAIEKSADYEKYLNKFDVIHLDIQWCCNEAGSADKTVSFIKKTVLFDLRNIYGDLIPENITEIAEALSYISDATGNRFVIIIDEWDVLIRDEAENNVVQKEYFDFLCGLFKGAKPTKYIALAYMTGILPIKKYIAQSVLNNFDEYTMISDGLFESYIGFTDDEVKLLCEKYHKDFQKVKFWYDGYKLNGCHLYNSWAIINLMLRGNFDYYWSRTGTYESIVPLINMNFDGLKTAVMMMLSGDVVPVRTRSYQNDMVTFKNSNDVITALIHLGYLAYNEEEGTAYIPNEDVRINFLAVMRKAGEVRF